MLARFRGIDADAGGNFKIRFRDENGEDDSLVIDRGAVPYLIAALLAQAEITPPKQKYTAQPIRTVSVSPIAGADGSPGLQFSLAAGFEFPIVFPVELTESVRVAVVEAEQMAGRPSSRLS